jgi:hypothetical protein
MEPPVGTKRFRVALSFPGEYRGRAEKIAEALAGTEAEALINETGYHRRDGELEKLRQRLAESRA